MYSLDAHYVYISYLKFEFHSCIGCSYWWPWTGHRHTTSVLVVLLMLITSCLRRPCFLCPALPPLDVSLREGGLHGVLSGWFIMCTYVVPLSASGIVGWYALD